MSGYYSADATAPASRAIAITTNDATDIENTRGIYVGGAGDVKVTLYGMASGTFVVFSAVPAGTVLPIQAKRVWTASTATLMLALY